MNADTLGEDKQHTVQDIPCRAYIYWSNGCTGIVETYDGTLHARLLAPSDDWMEDEGSLLWRGSSDRLDRIVGMLAYEVERGDVGLRSGAWRMNGLTISEDREAITVLVDYAPPENGEAFSAWCARYDFTPLNSPRRAWCGQFSTYFRDAIGVAQTRSGEQFLVYADDFAEGEAGV